MKKSQELQSNKTALMNYRTARNDGTGEPAGVEFWLGQYNEVLIDKAQYVSNLPRSVAALFHIEGGDDAESCSCIRQARAAMIARLRFGCTTRPAPEAHAGGQHRVCQLRMRS